MRLRTTDEVAEILRVHRMTVYREIARGKLRALRIGRSYRVRLEDLSDYLAGGAVA